MWYIKSENEQGEYVTPTGSRVVVVEGKAPCPTTGWTWFDSIDDCLKAWGLTYDPLPEPRPEN